MKTKNHNFKFNKKSPKTTKTIEINNPKYSNDYSKIICEILNIKINKSIDRYTISNKQKYNHKHINKISHSINNNIQVLKKVKPKKFIIELNSPKKDNKKNSNINDNSNDVIQRGKKTHFLNQTSLIMNMNTNYKKNRRFFQSKSERNFFKNTNCHKVLTSLNKNLKININLCNQNDINLIKKQTSFNNKVTNKENKSIEKKTKDSEDHKDKTISVLYNYDGILRQKSSNEKMNKMNYEINHTNNSKIIIKKYHKNKNTDIYNLDKFLTKMNKKGNINSIRKDLNQRKINTKMKLNNKKIIIYNNADISPFKIKTKTLNKKFKQKNYMNTSDNKSRNSISNNSFSRFCSNNITHYNHHFLNINGIKTEFIELNLTNNNKSFIYNTKKKMENDLIINEKNNLTLRVEHTPRNTINYTHEKNKTPLKLSHSYKTVFIQSKKTRSLSRKRDEKKIKNILKLSEMSDEEKPENKMNYLLKSLENEKIILKSRKNCGLKSEPKKLIDRIRKVIKIKNHNL